MDNKKIVKDSMLVRKISEYFRANPLRQTVILNATLGESKLFWKATRDGNKFNVTEVNTSTNKFIFEMKQQLRETSAPFSDISKSFMDTVSNKPDPADIQNTIRVLNAKAVMLADPAERDRAGNMIASLNALASAGRLSSKVKPQMGAQSAGGVPPSPFNKKESKLAEDGTGQASFAFTAASAAFMKGITPPPDHERLNTAFRTINQLLTKINDPNERQQVGSMIGTLTHMVDATTSGGGAMARPPASAPAAKKESRLYEASQAFAKASQEFMHGMTPPFDHARLSQALNACNQLMGQVTDANERNQLGSLIGTLTNQVDSTTAGGGSAINKGAAPTKTAIPAPMAKAAPPTFKGPPPAAPLKQGASYPGNRVSEAQKKKIQRIKMPSL